ncbi:MAG: ATP-binding protein, partial [Clostridium sp.]
IYPILNYRYNNNLPTIFSSECSREEILELDEALGGRIIESCGENIMYFKGREYNYRLRER